MVSHDGLSDNLSVSTVISFLEGITLIHQNVSITNNTKDTELTRMYFLSKDELFLPLHGVPPQVPLNTTGSSFTLNLASTPCLLGVEVFILNVKRIEVRDSNSERKPLRNCVWLLCQDTFRSRLLSMSFCPHVSL